MGLITNDNHEFWNYSGNPEHEPLPNEPPADYDRKKIHDCHL
jgi:hypothetical protein